MRHRKSLAAEMMRKAAIKECLDAETMFSRDGLTGAASGCRACANKIKALPVILDHVPRMEAEEVSVIDAATRWAGGDLNDPVSQKALASAVMGLRSARNSGA